MKLSQLSRGSYDGIVDRCCDAWNKLAEQPWKIMPIDRREWASEF